MNNTLAPLKTASNPNGAATTSSSSSTDLNRQAKLDAIHPGKHEDEAPKHETQAPPPKTEARPPAVKADEQPSAPKADPQPQHKVEEHHENKHEQSRNKDVLKGKPIIFVGGGPGTEQANEIVNQQFVSLFQAVAKEHNARK